MQGITILLLVFVFSLANTTVAQAEANENVSLLERALGHRFHTMDFSSYNLYVQYDQTVLVELFNEQGEQILFVAYFPELYFNFLRPRNNPPQSFIVRSSTTRRLYRGQTGTNRPINFEHEVTVQGGDAWFTRFIATPIHGLQQVRVFNAGRGAGIANRNQSWASFQENSRLAQNAYSYNWQVDNNGRISITRSGRTTLYSGTPFI